MFHALILYSNYFDDSRCLISTFSVNMFVPFSLSGMPRPEKQLGVAKRIEHC